MKKIFFIALILTPLLVMAADPGFEAGASFGKDNAAAGSNSLKNPSVVTSAIPGYTDKPPESGYYNGVSGGDGGLAGAGLGSLPGSNAGQAVIDSGNKNPPPVINPDAPFITVGKDAESSAEGIIDGTGQQCQESTVSKTTFENFTCERDVNSSSTCSRTASIQLSKTGKTKAADWVLDAKQSIKRSLTAGYWYQFDFVAPDDMIVTKGRIEVRYPLGTEGVTTNDDVRVNGLVVRPAKNTPMPVTFPRMDIKKGQIVSFSTRQYIGDSVNQRPDACNMFGSTCAALNYGLLEIRVTLEAEKAQPELVWNEVCDFNKTTAISMSGSVCTEPGGNKTVSIDGQNYTMHSDCWKYTDNYIVSTNSAGNCGSLMNDKNCTRTGHTCTEVESGYCIHQKETWQCQKTYQSGGLVCGGEFICQNGDCGDTNDAGYNGFDEAVAKLAGLASAAEDVKAGGSDIEVKAFTGKVMRCRKAFAGFSNCCKDSGWGQDVGLSACDDDEKAIGKAKAKKITVKVGERCDKKVLGACIQKSQVYCVFDGKLSRIIQEQGRRDQLGVNFGSGDSPNCRGITVPELQSIDFDLINFSDFYSEMMDNQKIPDTAVMVKQIKDRIAAQVPQQQSKGGKK